MRARTVLAVAGTSAVVAAAAGGALAAEHGPVIRQTPAAEHSPAARRPAVRVRIEGLRQTLLLSTKVRVRSGWITRYGAPTGKCPAQSAQGALNAATNGHWKGTWSTTYNEYFVTQILGEKPPDTHHFWEIFVDNKAASVGACDVKLRRGEQLLFADETGSLTPSGLTAPRSEPAHATFTIRLVGYSSQGKAKPLAGVRVTGNGIRPVTTNAGGKAKVTATKDGRLILRAAPRGHIRTEAVVKVRS